MSDLTEIRALARRQLGLVHRDQLRHAGFRDQDVWRMTKAGALEPLSPSVLRLGGAPPSRRQSVYAAVLDGGNEAAASLSSAAALWQLPGHDLLPAHVTRLSRRHRRTSNLGIVHEPKLLLPSHVASMGPLRLTTPSRTVFDLAAVLHIDRLRRVTDDVLAKRLSNVRALHEMLKLLARRGRSGIANMRIVLDERPIGYRPPESHLESRVQHILWNADLRQFERQIDVGDDDGWIGRVDFLERQTSTILQADGDRWHAQLVDRLADATQTARLERAGFVVVRVTEAQVWMRPHEVARAAHRARRRELAPPRSGHASSTPA
jgi:very-short-patch-repair endonuclease